MIKASSFIRSWFSRSGGIFRHGATDFYRVARYDLIMLQNQARRLLWIATVLFGVFILTGCNENARVNGNTETLRDGNGGGSLAFIGGGELTDSLVKKLLIEANFNEEDDYVVILTLANEYPDSIYRTIDKRFAGFIGKKSVNMPISPASSGYRQKLDSLEHSRLIFISGGDQRKFMEKVKGTAIEQSIMKAFKRGATIAGNGAGAAVLCEVMITGDQQFVSEYEPTFDRIWSGNAIYDSGLGLLDWAIIDQNFIDRSRYNRLFSALSDHPGSWGIGIDESTGVIIHGKKMEVIGENQVILIEPPNETEVQNRRIGMVDVKLHLLLPGDTFKAEKVKKDKNA